MEKNAESRIATIRKHSEKEARYKRIANQIINNTIFSLQDKIKALSPRIADLIKVANACGENGICLGEEPSNMEAPRFVTEGINHQLGFFAYMQNPYKGFGNYRHLHITGFGYKGGGCSGENFLVNAQGEIYQGWTHTSEKLIRKMKRFLDEFDNFETEFYDFIDRL